MDVGPVEATLVLEDGTIFEGLGFGHPGTVVGEVVFNTGMVGYTEALTDPSYRGQLLCLTYPLVGNYGVPSYEVRDEFGLPTYFESDRMQVKALIVHNLSAFMSHWGAVKSLNEWLYEEGIPGIAEIDTRRLTKSLRSKGVMMGALAVSKEEMDTSYLMDMIRKSSRYGEIDFVNEVSVKKDLVYGNDGKATVVLVDCGTKYSIVRHLLKRGFRVVRVPYDADLNEIMKHKPRGVVISNGPGDPKVCSKTIKVSRELMEEGVPSLGICLGNQILALAAGGNTFKLKYGHRGQNKPCINMDTERSYVTSQNHGYAVEIDSLNGTGFKLWFKNADDGTVEGLKHEDRPCFAVQFHPEASPGPYDTTFIFDIFKAMVMGEKTVEIGG